MQFVNFSSDQKINLESTFFKYTFPDIKGE